MVMSISYSSLNYVICACSCLAWTLLSCWILLHARFLVPFSHNTYTLLLLYAGWISGRNHKHSSWYYYYLEMLLWCINRCLVQIQRLFFHNLWLLILLKFYTALGGVNIKELLDDASEEIGGKQLLDFSDRMGDRIQVFLEWFHIASLSQAQW